jgi:hypothetical protein
MPPICSFKNTVVSRMQRDLAFKDALHVEAAQALLADDVDTGKMLLRDYLIASAD